MARAKKSKKLLVSLIASTIGRKPRHRQTVKGLGLKKIGQQVLREDTPEIRGMVKSVMHLVKVEEVNATK